MDTKHINEQLQQLTRWRQQLVGLGLLPPDVTAILSALDEATTALGKLEANKAELESAITALATQHEHDRKRVGPLRAEVAQLEKRKAQLDADFAALKAKFRTPATV